MKELLKECVSVIVGVGFRHTHLTQGMYQDLLRRCYAAITAEEKREPDAWMHVYNSDSIISNRVYKSNETLRIFYTIPLYRSIAPDTQPAGGAAQCPRCEEYIRSGITAGVSCTHARHDSKPKTTDSPTCPRCTSDDKSKCYGSCTIKVFRHPWHYGHAGQRLNKK